jgi:5S rRNA maturation endonuclease (ribonuclease M5)
MLRGKKTDRVIIVEGEPDFLTHSTLQPADAAVIGIVTGSWSPSFVEKLSPGCDVIVRTHSDEAGERYAKQIIDSLGDRCRAWRAA